ncbi:hypothetical protein H5410_062304 [Solanum commersonii]|uniref:Uncharacterized protein n=1 Tax=Solanum commersonii TaxID=4109 RepID=A0A9J5WAI6_SOLCO|nr:hypothetical protein H5410_062304 [Solanum commersonii]
MRLAMETYNNQIWLSTVSEVAFSRWTTPMSAAPVFSTLVHTTMEDSLSTTTPTNLVSSSQDSSSLPPSSPRHEENLDLQEIKSILELMMETQMDIIVLREVKGSLVELSFSEEKMKASLKQIEHFIPSIILSPILYLRIVMTDGCRPTILILLNSSSTTTTCCSGCEEVLKSHNL